MKNKDKQVTANRRSFLKLAGASAIGGGAALGAGATAALASDAEKEKSGSYRETEHIKTYYELAKF